jgi:hypothetical protein
MANRKASTKKAAKARGKANTKKPSVEKPASSPAAPKGPTWAEKKKQIINETIRLGGILMAVQAALNGLNDVVQSDPGDGPTVKG